MFVDNVSLGRQCALQGGPLTRDPPTNQSDRGNNGNDQNSQQNGVFDESGTILVLAQLANEIRNFRHDKTPYKVPCLKTTPRFGTRFFTLALVCSISQNRFKDRYIDRHSRVVVLNPHGISSVKI
jgi:hypothetical protein